MPSPAPGQPRVIRLGPRPRATEGDTRPARRVGRVRRSLGVPGVAVLVVASLLWPFLVLAPLAGAGPSEVRLVEDDRKADLGVAYGPGGATPVTARTGLVVDRLSAVLLKTSLPGPGLPGVVLAPGTVLGPETATGPGPVVDPSALAASGIPESALRAYRAAEASLAASDPTCRLPWWLLAGIGRVESDHGRFAGAVMLEDGTSQPPVIGIPLDGRPGVALIRDTDGGALDGDTVYDRAVGPMQFIPSTWAGSQVDGDGDGKADPHDIDDAALASGRYLCAGGSDLSTDAGLRAAVFRYNHSDAYVELVLAVGRAYESGTVPVIPAVPAPTTSAPAPTTAPPTSPPTTTAPPTSAPPTSAPPTTSPPPTTTPPEEPAPTCTPTADPTGGPTADPTDGPTTDPTGGPTADPTGDPTGAPTAGPTDPPTTSPTCTAPPTTPTGTATPTP